MVGDRAGVIEAEHFESHCWTSPSGDQAPQHFGLEQVVVGVIMPLAEKDEISARQTGDHARGIDEPGGGDVPYAPG